MAARTAGYLTYLARYPDHKISIGVQPSPRWPTLATILALPTFRAKRRWWPARNERSKTTKAYVAPAPGCAAAVSLRGETAFEKVFGLADLEHNVPNTTQTIFESGSVAKQFTAAAIVLLQQDGKLSLDDPVRKYIPELPDYDTPLTDQASVESHFRTARLGHSNGPHRRGSRRPSNLAGSRTRRDHPSARTRLHAGRGVLLFKQWIQSGGDHRRACFETKVSGLRRGATIQTARDEEQFVARRLPADCPRPRPGVCAAGHWPVATQHAFHECLWKRSRPSAIG